MLFQEITVTTHDSFIYFFNKFIYFWLRWVLVAVHGLSLVVASGGYSSLRCAAFSLQWLLLLWSMGSRRAGFSSCGTWAQQLWLAGSRAQAQQLWRTGLVALWHVESSGTRARTCVPCIGRRILNHCATREAHDSFIVAHGIITSRNCIIHFCLALEYINLSCEFNKNTQHKVWQFQSTSLIEVPLIPEDDQFRDTI